MAKVKKETAVCRVVHQMHKVLSSPKKWIRQHYAKTKSGKSVLGSSKGAVQFCLMGALDRAALDVKATDSTKDKVNDALCALLPGGIEKFNDKPTTTFADIQAVLGKLEAKVCGKANRVATA